MPESQTYRLSSKSSQKGKRRWSIVCIQKRKNYPEAEKKIGMQSANDHNVESEPRRFGLKTELQRLHMLQIAAARTGIHPDIGLSAMTEGVPVFPYPSQLETIQNPIFSDAGRISWHQQLAGSNHMSGLGCYSVQPNQASADLQRMAGLSRRSHPNGMSHPFYGVDSTHHGQDLLRRACRANEELRRFAWSLRSRPEIGGSLPHNIALSREYSTTNQRLAVGNEHRQWVENSGQDSPPRRLKRNDSHEGYRREDGERRMDESNTEESSATEESEGGKTQQASDNVADQLKQIPKPSRPLTAYNIFFKDQRLVLLKEASAHSEGGKSSKNSRKNQSTGIPFTLMGKKIGSKWQNISVEEKKFYIEKADQDKVRHKNEMKEYNRKREVLMSSYHEKQMSSVDDSVLSRYYAHHGGKRSLEQRKNRVGKSKRSRKDNSYLPKSETLGDGNCPIAGINVLAS